MTDYDLSKIKDPRIGVFAPDYAIIKKPTQYATGATWIKGDNASPTRVSFGPDMRFFYFLPVRMVRAPEGVEEQLLDVIAKAAIVPKATEAVKEETKTTVKPVIKPAKAAEEE